MSYSVNERHGLWERHHVMFLAIAFGFTWVFWVGSWLIAQAIGIEEIDLNADFVWAWVFDGQPLTSVFWVSLLSLVGVYGPMLGGIVATHLDPEVDSAHFWERVRRTGVGSRWYGLALGILTLVAGPAALVVVLTADMTPDAPDAPTVVIFLGVFFVFQMLTSGTEELGWRGYLNEKLRRGRDFWDTGWAVGLPWAVWHLPVVLIIFAQQGMAPISMVGSLAGFGIGIVAAAILHAWFYERTQSVFVNVFIHATFNTIPLATVLLYEDSPAAVMANLALWAVVVFLKRRHDKGQTEMAVEEASGSRHDSTHEI